MSCERTLEICHKTSSFYELRNEQFVTRPKVKSSPSSRLLYLCIEKLINYLQIRRRPKDDDDFWVAFLHFSPFPSPIPNPIGFVKIFIFIFIITRAGRKLKIRWWTSTRFRQRLAVERLFCVTCCAWYLPIFPIHLKSLFYVFWWKSICEDLVLRSCLFRLHFNRRAGKGTRNLFTKLLSNALRQVRPVVKTSSSKSITQYLSSIDFDDNPWPLGNAKCFFARLFVMSCSMFGWVGKRIIKLFINMCWKQLLK